MSLSQALSVASSQHGVITADQATLAGLTSHQVRHLVDSGRWERRGPRVFTVAGAPQTFEQDVLVACLLGDGRGVASHRCAARLLGLACADAAVEITIPRGAWPGAQRPGVTVHTSRHLDARDCARVGRIPVTKAARVVVDMLPDAAVFAVADDVLWRLRDRREIRRVWERAAAGRHAARLEEVLLPWYPGPHPGSPKEMALCRVLILHGLPAPVRQHRLTVHGRRLYLDLAYPAHRLALEYDGRRDHGPRRWDAAASREEELWSIGWIRLPAGRHDLEEPHATAYCEVVRGAMATTERSEAAR